MINKTVTREEMIIAVRHAGELIFGDHSRIEAIAEEWIEAEFSVTEAEAYWKADVFTAEAAAQLRDAGIEADNERLAMTVHGDVFATPFDSVGSRGDSMTYGYALANGDAGIEDPLYCPIEIQTQNRAFL